MDLKLEPVLKLLFVCMVFFTLVLFAAEVWFANDSQLFQVVAGVLTGVVGAFLGRIKPSKGDTGDTGLPGAPGVGPITDSEVNINKPL